MKFKSSINIQAPRDKVVRLFMDQQHLAKHQNGFIKKVLVSGVYGENDAVSIIYFKQGRGQMELEEIVISNQLPDSIETFLHHKHMDNTYKCSFITTEDNTTDYLVEGEYVAVRGFMPKMMMRIFPGIFKKQPVKWMINFKEFVENHQGV